MFNEADRTAEFLDAVFGFDASAEMPEYLMAVGEGVKYVCAEDHTVSQKTAEASGYTLYRKVFPFVCVREDDDDGAEEDEE